MRVSYFILLIKINKVKVIYNKVIGFVRYKRENWVFYKLKEDVYLLIIVKSIVVWFLRWYGFNDGWRCYIFCIYLKVVLNFIVDCRGNIEVF